MSPRLTHRPIWRSIPEGTVVTGKAEAGSTVTLRDGDDVIGRGVAGPDGSFEILLSTPRLNGQELVATATDPAGNTGPEGSVLHRTSPRRRPRSSPAWWMT
jgi:hypothetical protein